MPKNFHLVRNWILEIDGIERVRFGSVDIPEEIAEDIVIHESAELYPQRIPADPPQVDVRVEAPAFSDETVKYLWEKTVNQLEGGQVLLESMYFTATLYQLDRDKKTKLKKWELKETYCAGRITGKFSSTDNEARMEGFVLRPREIVPTKLV